MAYKKLIKVSNVCQLLDKSKYPATQTNAGVTVTNNNDGTLTVSGTSTAFAYINFGLYPKKNNGHTLLLRGADSSASVDRYFLALLNQNNANDYGNGVICKTDALTPTFWGLVFKNNVTFDNVVLKPQLFDLTEMYGAGNEPTTVEQFRQDFPEEMYDYSPHCWLTSYKRVFMTGGGNYLTSYQRNLTCKTKNLFDKSLIIRPQDFQNCSIIETHKNGWTLLGKSSSTPGNANWSNGWFQPFYSVYELGLDKCFYAKAGETYTISADFTLLEDNRTQSCMILQGNKYISLELNKTIRNSSTFTYDKDGYKYFTFTLNSSKIRIENIQLELGDTATEYVPYGHL